MTPALPWSIESGRSPRCRSGRPRQSLLRDLFGRRLGHRAHWVAVPAVGLAFAVALATFLQGWQGHETFVSPLFDSIVAGDGCAERGPRCMGSWTGIGGMGRHVALVVPGLNDSATERDAARLIASAGPVGRERQRGS